MEKYEPMAKQCSDKQSFPFASDWFFSGQATDDDSQSDADSAIWDLELLLLLLTLMLLERDKNNTVPFICISLSLITLKRNKLGIN